MSLIAAGSAQGVATDHPLCLVPFCFWLPFNGRNRRQRSGVEAWAGSGGSAPSDPAAASDSTSLAMTELQQAICAQLSALGHPGAEPLRWAITGTDPQRGLRLEGIGLWRTPEGADRDAGISAADKHP